MSIGRSVLRLRYTLAVVCGLLLTSVVTFAQEGDGIPTDEASISAGMELFDGNCSSCHQIHEKGVGPALKNVYERRDVKWLTSFIKHPGKVIESGDAYAVALYDKFKPTIMTNQDLTDAEILQVLAYVKDGTIKGPAKPEAAADAAGADGAVAPQEGMMVSSNLLVGVIIGLLVLLGIVLIVLVVLANVLTQYLRQQKGLGSEEEAYINDKFSFAAIFKSQAFIGMSSFVFVMIVAKVTIDSLFAVGVQQGYSPDQPIQFSHKLHAGYYEIDCKYCHTGVEKSKNANIPSANICMNCHNSIRQNSPEIQKIYAAIEKDEPIQWVRVHNLPDLAYFNHSQHVKVGGVECQTCHGEIEKMEVVQQHSLLTMGWCIDCHRQTDVNAKGNAYYDKMVEMHDATSKDPMKVKDIGGLECAKCHY